VRQWPVLLQDGGGEGTDREAEETAATRRRNRGRGGGVFNYLSLSGTGGINYGDGNCLRAGNFGVSAARAAAGACARGRRLLRWIGRAVAGSGPSDSQVVGVVGRLPWPVGQYRA